MSEPFVAYAAKGKTLLMLAGAATFVALGLWFVLDAESIAASSGKAL